MDTSEEYIKMCDCPEIQLGEIFMVQPYRDGNFCWDKVNKKIRVDSCPGGENTSVWLPRQDQIQEMMGFKYAGPGYIRKLWDFTLDESEKRAYNSLEQLWLAFYMFEKHKKTWGGEKWVV